jgi:nitrate reductase NapE component
MVSGYPAEGSVRGNRRRRPMRTFLIVVIVLLGVLVAADFGARAFAQGKLASEIKSHGFPKKPDVSISGFPFLTQLASRNFKQVSIHSANVPEGPLRIKKISAVMSDVKITSGFSGATVDHLTGSVFITFPELAHAVTSQASGLGQLLGGAGLKLSAAGSNEVKTTFSLVVISGSATWRITPVGGNQINVKLVSSNGLPSSLLGSVSNIRIRLPDLPFHLSIQSLNVTPAGISGTLTGSHLSFGG